MSGTTYAKAPRWAEAGWSAEIAKRFRLRLLLLPALLFLCLFYLYPLAKLALISLESPDITLKQYVAFFTDSLYIKVLFKTIKLAAWTTLFTFLIGYPTAYVLAHVKPGLRNLLLILVVIPYLTSFLVRTYAWIIILYDRGIINSLLMNLGIVDEPVKLVFNTLGVYIGLLHVMLPLMILSLYSVMHGIDPRFVKAAYASGAGPVRAFFTIYWPLSLPGVRSGCLLVFLLSLGFYITPALLGGLSDVMLVNFIDNEIRINGNWAFASAASIILLAITMIGLFLLSRFQGGAARRAKGPCPGPRPAARNLPRSAWLEGLLSGLDEKLAARRRKRWRKCRERDGSASIRWPWINRPFAVLILVYLVVPSLVVIPMSFSSASYLTFPPPGWSTRWYENFFALGKWTDAAILSLEVAVLTTLFATLVGSIAAYSLVRTGSTKGLLMGLFVSPILVPPIVLAVGLYALYVELGIFGTKLGLIIGHSISSMAYVVVIVSATLSRFDFTLERASMSLGAGPVRTFFRVTLPVIRPGIIAAALFAFINSFDELVISVLVSGVGRQTLPVVMWSNLRNEIDPTVAAISTMLVLLPLLWLLALEITRRSQRLDKADITTAMK